MSRTTFLIAVIAFIALVAAGVSVALGELNRMVYPAGPVRALTLQEKSPGIYHVKFLGEELRVELPAGLAPEHIPGHAGELIREVQKIIGGAGQNFKQHGEKALKNYLTVLQESAVNLAGEVYCRALDTIEQLPLPQRQHFVRDRDY